MEFYRLPQVLKRIGISRSKLYADIKNGLFPAPIKLGPRTVGWLNTELDTWVTQRIEATRRTPAT